MARSSEGKSGRPAVWGASQLAALFVAVELLKERNRRLSDRSACELLSQSPQWREYSRKKLQNELIAARSMHSDGLIGEVIREEDGIDLRSAFLAEIVACKKIVPET